MTAAHVPVIAPAADATPARRGIWAAVTTRRVMRAMLWAQIALAGLMLATQALDPAPVGEGDIRPAPTLPVAPGDQLRPYDPRMVPRDPGRQTPDFALPGEMGPLAARPIDLGPLGPGLLLAGQIGPGDSDRIERALDAAGPELRAVALHSPGGVVDEGLRLGALIRARGLMTVVIAGASCNSACTLVLFGGVARHVSAQAWIGMHQARTLVDRVLPIGLAEIGVQEVQSRILAHTGAMGVDPLVQVHALATPPDQAYFLVPEELTRYRVATDLID